MSSNSIDTKLYWVGDPCYVLCDENGFDWSMLLTFTGLFGLYDLSLPLEERASKSRPVSERNGVFQITGHDIAVSSTAYGDGHYLDQWQTGYGVDSGLLACIPLAMLPDDFAGKEGGHTHEAPSDVDVSVEYKDGLITFLWGCVRIDTSGLWDAETGYWSKTGAT